MKLLTLAIILTFSTTALASPFIVSDPNPSAVGGVCKLMIDGVEQPEIYPLEPDGSIKIDANTIPPGQHEIKVKAGTVWPGIDGAYTWSSEWSSPFLYTFPSKPGAHTGLGIKL